jgi:plasmid maintenance system antidote protein VapI
VSTVTEILEAVRRLTPDEVIELRRALDTLGAEEWDAALDQATAEWHRSGRTDDDIDAAVLRRRYEGRS